MFDDIPTRFWLLMAIAAFAFAPTRYVYSHLAHSPERRDITLPTEDLSWRTSARLIRSSALLALLSTLAIFISTPAAEEFAQSPSFVPTLMLGLSTLAFYTVLEGFRKGRIQPLVRGISSYFERATQPKRFWASLSWNALLGCGCLFLAVVTMQQEREDRCYDSQDRYSPKDELSACDELLARNGNTKEEQADILAARGAAYHRLGNHEKALADYDQAIALDPRDSHSLYNRGLIYEELDDPGSALFAYAESLEIEPNNADAYLNKGTILLDRAKLDEAVVDFTRAHELEPSDPWALASRGITYAWKRDRARAERDFEAVERMAPYNPVLVRGRALLSMHAGEFRAAVDQLTVALLLDREDMWSLNMRAEAYRQLGEQEEAQADIERLRQLRSETG